MTWLFMLFIDNLTLEAEFIPGKQYGAEFHYDLYILTKEKLRSNAGSTVGMQNVYVKKRLITSIPIF